MDHIDLMIEDVMEGASSKDVLNELISGGTSVSFPSSKELLRAVSMLSQYGYNDGSDFEITGKNTVLISKLIYKSKEVKGVLGSLKGV